MLSRIRSLFAGERGLPREQVESLGRLAPDERIAGIAAAPTDGCVKEAAGFVEDEHRRPDSPFRDLPKSGLFHELLVMNFWMLESLLGKRQPELLDRVYHHYSTSFVWGWESGQKELLASMREKFRTYDRAWDEHTGHQDVFARQAIGIIFGGREVACAPQASFWLISYADRAMKDLAGVAASVERLLAGPPAAR